MALIPYQYEYNGFVMGANTGVIVERLNGLLGLPGLDVSDTKLEGQHGSTGGQGSLMPRSLDFDLHILASMKLDAMELKMQEMRRAFQPQRLDQANILKPLYIQRPATVLQQLLVRCDKRDFASSYAVAKGHAAGSVQLLALDPVIYSVGKKTAQAVMPSGATSVVLGGLDNDGDHPDGDLPVITVRGPARDPLITHNSGQFLRFLGLDLTATQTLTIDMKNRTVYVASTNRFAKLHIDSEWFGFLPGINSLTYTRSNVTLTGAGSTLTATWRDTWT